MAEKSVEQETVTREELLAYKNFNKSKKKLVEDHESSTSNDIATKDWTKEVKSLANGKLKVSCANETLILPIEFTRKKG